MPIPPPSPPLAPYDTVNDVLDVARVRMNDAIEAAGGDILTNDQPFTQRMVNMAWRRLQSYLANLGYSRLKKPLTLFNYPPVANYDVSTSVQLTWSYYFDGTSFFYPPNVEVFPQDFILPLWVKERVAGTNSSFSPMELAVDGLPDWRKVGFNRMWMWENDTLYMPGSLYRMDLQLKYAAFLPDFVTVGPTEWFNQPVPIMRCMDALAYYFCDEADGPRNAADGDPFITKAESAAKLIFNQEVSQKQRRPVSRRCYAGHGRQGYGAY